MEREKFGSRLGFILISAGCAIGIGNVWRFPYVAGNNGGGIFVLLYMLFLLTEVQFMDILGMIGNYILYSSILLFQDGC